MPQFFEYFKNLFARFVEIEKFKLYCWNAKLAEEGELKLRMREVYVILIYVYRDLLLVFDVHFFSTVYRKIIVNLKFIQ